MVRLKTEENLLTKIPLFIRDARALSDQILEILLSPKANPKTMLKKANACLVLLSELDQEYAHLGYEVGRHHSKKEIKETLKALSHFYHYLSGAASWLLHLQDRSLFLALKDELRALLDAILRDLNDINTALIKEKDILFSPEFSTRYGILQQKAATLEKNPAYSRQAWLDYYALFRFLKDMDNTLKVLEK